MKLCSKCKVEKDESEFGKARNRKDGLYNYCRECKSLSDKKYRQTPGYKERKNRNSREQYKRNPDRYRKYGREYAKTKWHSNPKAKIRDKKWKALNQEKIKAYSKRYVNELRDAYIRGNLLRDGFSREQIEGMPEIINLKKQIIKIKRHVKQNKCQKS